MAHQLGDSMVGGKTERSELGNSSEHASAASRLWLPHVFWKTNESELPTRLSDWLSVWLTTPLRVHGFNVMDVDRVGRRMRSGGSTRWSGCSRGWDDVE